MESVKSKSTSKATVLFENDRFDQQKITWELGSKLLRLCSTGGPGEGAMVLDSHAIRGTAPISIEKAQAEADKWFAAIDVFEHEPAVEIEDEQWDV